MSDILAGLAFGAGGAGASGLMGFGASYLQQKYTRENMKRAYSLGQMEELRRASNQTKGLQMAGLNPALASEGKFSPASVSAPSVPNMPFPSVDFAQSSLMSAEAKKAEAEAESIKIDNENKLDANMTAVYNLENFFNGLQREALEDGDLDLAENYSRLSSQVGSVGALRSLHDYFNMADSSVQYRLHHIDYQFTSKVVDEQLKKGYFRDVAKLPRTERLKFAKEIDHLNHVIKNLDMSTVKTSHDITLTDAEIERVKYLARQINNSDVNSMVAEGKYAQAAAVIATHWIEDAPESIINAVGVGAKAKSAEAFAEQVQHNISK